MTKTPIPPPKTWFFNEKHYKQNSIKLLSICFLLSGVKTRKKLCNKYCNTNPFRIKMLLQMQKCWYLFGKPVIWSDFENCVSPNNKISKINIVYVVSPNEILQATFFGLTICYRGVENRRSVIRKVDIDKWRRKNLVKIRLSARPPYYHCKHDSVVDMPQMFSDRQRFSARWYFPFCFSPHPSIPPWKFELMGRWPSQPL